MRVSRIDWQKVQHLMIDHRIGSKRELARRAEIHYNTLYNEGPYFSTTLDKLADLFDCPHEDLVVYIEDVSEALPPSPATVSVDTPPPTNKLTVGDLRRRHNTPLIDDTAAQATPEHISAMEERRAKLLEQARQRLTESDYTALASEEVLAREWLTPEEDEAWAKT